MATKTFLLSKDATVKIDMESGLSFNVKSTHYLPQAEKGKMITMVSPDFLVTNAELIEPLNHLLSPKMCRVKIKEGTFNVPYHTILGWEYTDVTKFNGGEL